MSIISIKNLNKEYKSAEKKGPSVKALTDVNLEIREGEIFGLLGENGAGKTTMIGVICGLVKKSSGTVTVMGKDVVKDYRFTRKNIGLVPQEVSLDIFMPIKKMLTYQRGYFGLPKDEELVDQILKDLQLYEKKDSPPMELSGGMQRRLLIAKALVHEPKILFLDEPTAGVDVQLRQDLWKMIRRLNDNGTTIILTTHYIEEAQQMADRIGIIQKGEILLVEEKEKLLNDLGKKKMTLFLSEAMDTIPENLKRFNLTLSSDKKSIEYEYQKDKARFGELAETIRSHGFKINDVATQETSLEEIFVNMIQDDKPKQPVEEV